MQENQPEKEQENAGNPENGARILPPGWNPKLKDWLKKHPDVTFLGFFWAGYWRIGLIVYALIFLVSLLLGLLSY